MYSVFERLTYSQLFAISEPKRVLRAKTVKGPALKVDGMTDGERYYFNCKSFPSTTGLRHHGYIHLFRPKRKMTLEQCECELDCTCFAPDTLVLMGDGTYRKISDVQIGELVYTHTGNLQKVLNNKPRKLKENESVYQVDVAGFPDPLIVTGNHPFYTLGSNDRRLCGCGAPLNRKKVSPRILEHRFLTGHHRKGKKLPDGSKKFIWKKVEDFTEKEWFLTPWAAPGSVHFDTDTARLFGYYISDGYCSKIGHGGNDIRFCFNVNELDTLAKDVINIANKLGLRSSVYKHPTRNSIDVRIFSKWFKEFCVIHGGKGSHHKRLSPEVMLWDTEAHKNLLAGMILGDGWIDHKKGVIRYHSSSFDLVSQTATILNRMRIHNSIQEQGEKINSPGEFSHQVQIAAGEGAADVYEWLKPYLREKDLKEMYVPNKYGIRREEGVLRLLNERKKIEYNGVVYDLTVENDESFIAHGIAVHNCPDFRYRFSWAVKQRGSSHVGPRSLNKCWNVAPRKTNPTGKPGLCKHLLALRDYIWGGYSAFATDTTPDTSKKMATLLKYSNNRWIGWDGKPYKGKVEEPVEKVPGKEEEETLPTPAPGTVANARNQSTNLNLTNQTNASGKKENLSTSSNYGMKLIVESAQPLVESSQNLVARVLEAEEKKSGGADAEALELLRSIDASLKTLVDGLDMVDEELPDDAGDYDEFAELPKDEEDESEDIKLETEKTSK